MPPDDDTPQPWSNPKGFGKKGVPDSPSGQPAAQSAEDALEEIVETAQAAAASASERKIKPAEGAAAPATEQFNCPNCGGSIEVKAAGYSVSIACQYCASILDISNPDVRIIQRYEEEVRKLELPLGSRGEIRGVEWEVIGYMRLSENGAYPWDEYLLFNPYVGYRTLDTDGRGWTLSQQLTKMPEKKAMVGFTVDDEFYTPFYAQTRVQVDYVLGEFYWQVRIGEESITADFVRPGKMLSFERNAREEEWSLGELLEPNEVPDAFGIDPPKGGGLPMPHQPSPYRATAGMMMKVALGALAFIILVSIAFGGTSDPQTATINLATNGVEQSAKVGPVVLERPYQAVTVSARSPGIDNAWIDLSYTLTNQQTGEEYAANNVVEQYSGRDAEGNWSEGSRSSSSKFSMIPAGRYELTVEAAGSQWLQSQYGASNNAQVEVSIARGATFYSNFFLALLAVFIPALWGWFKHLGFESRRKSDSDFAPDDDD